MRKYKLRSGGKVGASVCQGGTGSSWLSKKSGRKLVIAGNIPEAEVEYFEKQIEPYLDNEQITYIGPVDDSQKNKLLGGAAALLMPILWEEPFGLVMTEAMACGTPVIALRRGSVPEIVRERITGFIRNDVDGLVERLKDLEDIDRAACRAEVERRFAGDVMIESYLSVYRKLLLGKSKTFG